jgi:hypothetical protein
VDGIGPRPRPVVGFGTSGVELSDSATTMLVMQC